MEDNDSFESHYFWKSWKPDVMFFCVYLKKKEKKKNLFQEWSEDCESNPSDLPSQQLKQIKFICACCNHWYWAACWQFKGTIGEEHISCKCKFAENEISV